MGGKWQFDPITKKSQNKNWPKVKGSKYILTPLKNVLIFFSLTYISVLLFPLPNPSILMSSTITVPPLEGFVMNRVQGDYFETLLYKIFVSIDEQTNVSEVGLVFHNTLDFGPLPVNNYLYYRLLFLRRKVMSQRSHQLLLTPFFFPLPLSLSFPLSLCLNAACKRAGD